MTKYDLEALKNFLDRNGALDSANRDLIENAIYFVNSNEYRAKDSVRCLARNLENQGKRDLAAHAYRLL